MVVIALVVLGVAGGFYGGVTYAQSQSNSSAADNFAQQRATAN